MWLVNLVFVTVAACFLQTGHGDVQVNGKSVQPRFLGTLNRYYVYSGGRGNGTEYIDLTNSENAINDLGLGGEENGGGEDNGGGGDNGGDGDNGGGEDNGGGGDNGGGEDNGGGTESGRGGEVQTKDFVIVIHGRDDSAFGNFGQTLKTSFVTSNPDLVVIVVDWSFLAYMDYTTASNAVPFIAGDIRTLILHLQPALKSVHIVGFDIGAHIAGIIGRDSRVNLQRITGLSPAGRNWDSLSQRLRATDAEYVQVIHTDYMGINAFGIGDFIGEPAVDMYANTGTSQPGCTTNANQCNHNRAWQLFAASLDLKGHLMGLRCETLADMTRNQCFGGPSVALGTNDLSTGGSGGIYRVNTGSVYPYRV